MELIDLSRELFHRTQTHPSHPPVIVSVWGDHSEKKVAGNTMFTSKALSIALSDHAGTHVDAPVHFDPAAAPQVRSARWRCSRSSPSPRDQRSDELLLGIPREQDPGVLRHLRDECVQPGPPASHVRWRNVPGAAASAPCRRSRRYRRRSETWCHHRRQSAA
jgi:hypothetical protein